MTDLVEGTVSHQHKFDGCMYGLKSQFQETPKPIKKPWKIVTWGVSFPKLHRKCDQSHVHAECAGGETRITQVYTKWIAKIIIRGINDHVNRNIPFVNVKVMKRWKAVTLDDAMKRTMSRDSENARSHPIKPVTTSACVCREPDAIDDLFERSLLCFAKLSIPSSCSLWSSTQLHTDSNPDLLFRGLRPEQLLTVRRKMSGGDDLKSLGQFSTNRISIAKKILEDLSTRVLNSRRPPPFQDTRGSNFHRLSSEEMVNQWIRFGMPPVVVYSAYFANCRPSDAATYESLELAYKILQRASDEEKQCTGWEFINKGARYVKVSSKKCQYDVATVGLLMDHEIYSRPDELWIVLTRGHVHFPEPQSRRRRSEI